MRRLSAALAVGGFLLLSACAPPAPQQAQMAPQPMPMQATPPPAPPKAMPQGGMRSTGPVTGSKGSFGAPSSTTAPLAKADPVYITRTGKKYHRADCQHLAKGAARMPRAQAQREKYTACDTCKP